MNYEKPDGMNDDQPQCDAPPPLESALEEALNAELYPQTRPPSSPAKGPESLETSENASQGEPEEVATNSVELPKDESKQGQLTAGQPLAGTQIKDGSLKMTVEGAKERATTSVSTPQVLHAHEETPESTEQQIVRELPGWPGRFVLQCFTLGGNLTLASRATGISIARVKTLRTQSEIFNSWLEAARRSGGDLIEAALHVSATTGDLRPIYQGGVLVGYERRKNVQAATVVLASQRPEYRTRGGDNSVTTNNQLNIAVSIATTAQEVQRLADEATARLFRGAGQVIEVDEVPELD